MSVLALTLVLALQVAAPETAQSADLVVFVAPGASDLGRAFQDEVLPQVRASAERASMTLRVVNIAEGAPAEVTMTPLLIHQSAGGRSVYQGRSNNLERMEAFLRTSRFVVQDGEPWVRKDLPVQRTGRALVAAPCKVTELSGDVPEGHDAAEFEARARAAIYSGFESFHVEPSIQFKRTDRAFYLDFYPYAADGEIYVSIALFSMFHCKEALWKTETAIQGSFAEFEEVFRRAARRGEEAIAEARRAPRSGDGFDPVPDGVSVKSWEELGLPLPAARGASADAGQSKPALRIEELPLKWSFELGGEEKADSSRSSSGIRFHFAPPLDSTAGEVGRATGRLEFAEAGRLRGVTGEVRCQTASVSLGWEDLDQTVHGESMLDVSQYPEAWFVLREFRSRAKEEAKLDWGRPTEVMATGDFVMKGREVPIEVRASLEFVVDANGVPQLSVEGAFELRLQGPFGIVGPDGPEVARDTLMFELGVVLVGG